MVWLPNAFGFGRHEERRKQSVWAYRRMGGSASRLIFIAIKQLLFRAGVAKLLRVL
jgi:hypothetical protein